MTPPRFPPFDVSRPNLRRRFHTRIYAGAIVPGDLERVEWGFNFAGAACKICCKNIRTFGRKFSIGYMGSNGVTLSSPLPVSFGNIEAGSTATMTLKYNIPAGVGSMRTRLEGTVSDAMGFVYLYP